MAWASRRVSTRRLLWVWALAHLGNFAGAVATAGLMYLTRQYRFGGGAVGEQALAIATARVVLGFTQAVVLGAFCNALVCLAVWLTRHLKPHVSSFLADNLLPVTIGNVIGGTLMVAAFY
jgi:formate/nitrite transporter FocA (FNT family)